MRILSRQFRQVADAAELNINWFMGGEQAESVWPEIEDYYRSIIDIGNQEDLDIAISSAQDTRKAMQTHIPRDDRSK